MFPPKKKPSLDVIIGAHAPDDMGGGASPMDDVVNKHAPDDAGGEDTDGEDAMHAFMEAFKSGDAKGMWNAFKSGAMCADEMPHEEGPHPDGMAHGGMAYNHSPDNMDPRSARTSMQPEDGGMKPGLNESHSDLKHCDTCMCGGGMMH